MGGCLGEPVYGGGMHGGGMHGGGYGGGYGYGGWYMNQPGFGVGPGIIGPVRQVPMGGFGVIGPMGGFGGRRGRCWFYIISLLTLSLI